MQTGKDRTRTSPMMSITAAMVVSRTVLCSAEVPNQGGVAWLCLQRRPSTVKCGQVTQAVATLTKPAIIVIVVANHHHTLRLCNREINLRKKNRKANLTEKMTSQEMFEAASASFEVLGISFSSLDVDTYPGPRRVNENKSYSALSVVYTKPVVPQRDITAKSRMKSSIWTFLLMQIRI